MELGHALDQISEIHGHLTRTEVYRGLRPAPVFLSGLLALGAAGLEPRLIGDAAGLLFVYYWLAVAAVSAIACGGDILGNYWLREDDFSRLRTRRVLAQFLPCLVAGAAITAGVTALQSDLVGLLPGLWAVLFSLGIFASAPYLPRPFHHVALFYLAAGSALLLWPGELAPGWGMGMTFGFGQILSAWVLHRHGGRQTHG